jgi:hypothetical protein
MFAFKRKKLIFIQKAVRCFLAHCQTACKEKVAWIHKKLHKMQSAVLSGSCRHHFLRAKKGMVKLQATYRREYLIFTIHNDQELKENVLHLFGLQVERLQQLCAADEEYNIKLLSAFYETVLEFYQLQTAERLRHQLFLINRMLNSNKDK